MPGIDGMGVAVWLCDDEAPRVRGAWAFLALPLQQCGREPLPRGGVVLCLDEGTPTKRSMAGLPRPASLEDTGAAGVGAPPVLGR